MGLVMVVWLEGAGGTAWWGQDVPKANFKPMWGSLYMAKRSPPAGAGERSTLCLGGSAGPVWWQLSWTGQGGMAAPWDKAGLCSQQGPWCAVHPQPQPLPGTFASSSSAHSFFVLQTPRQAPLPEQMSGHRGLQLQ